MIRQYTKSWFENKIVKDPDTIPILERYLETGELPAGMDEYAQKARSRIVTLCQSDWERALQYLTVIQDGTWEQYLPQIAKGERLPLP